MKQKWLDAIPVIWGFISLALLFWLIIYGFAWLFAPDKRTVEEILQDRYKSCIKHVELPNLDKCKEYLNHKP